MPEVHEPLDRIEYLEAQVRDFLSRRWVGSVGPVMRYGSLEPDDRSEVTQIYVDDTTLHVMAKHGDGTIVDLEATGGGGGGAEPIADAHIADPSDAHDASAVSYVPTGSIASTDVQAAIAEVATDYIAADAVLAAATNAHLIDTSDAHDASAVSFVPTGSIAATDMQAALAEVASEYIAADSAHVAASDPHSVYATDADLTAHLAAGDPHPGYATDADLTAHAAAADPHTGYVREADANWVDLTDGGASTLHSHAGGGAGHTIRENGTDQTTRSALNFIDTDAGAGLLTDDAGANETEVNLSLYALLLGRSGGQTIHGGTGASESLYLRSNSSGTQGNISLLGKLDVGGDIDGVFALTSFYGHRFGDASASNNIMLNLGVGSETITLAKTILRINPTYSINGNLGNMIGIEGNMTVSLPNTSTVNRTLTSLAALSFIAQLNNLDTDTTFTVTDFWGIKVAPTITSVTNTLSISRMTGIEVLVGGGSIGAANLTISVAYRSIYCNFAGTARSTAATRHLDLVALTAGTAQSPIYEQGSTAGDTHGNRFRSNSQFGSLTGAFAGGDGVIGIANATVVPTTSPATGGVLYAEGGALKWKSPNGLITTMGIA